MPHDTNLQYDPEYQSLSDKIERLENLLHKKNERIADLESRNRALGKEVAKTLADHFAGISKQITCLIDRYGEK